MTFLGDKGRQPVGWDSGSGLGGFGVCFVFVNSFLFFYAVTWTVSVSADMGLLPRFKG